MPTVSTLTPTAETPFRISWPPLPPGPTPRLGSFTGERERRNQLQIGDCLEHSASLGKFQNIGIAFSNSEVSCRDDPTIMAWGLANEARCVGDYSGSKLQVRPYLVKREMFKRKSGLWSKRDNIFCL
jgi:hypothetical protein